MMASLPKCLLIAMPVIFGLVQPASAQWVREGYGAVYGGVGTAGGAALGAIGGPWGAGAGGIAGAYAGQQLGYRVYDSTARSIQSLQSSPPRYQAVYPDPRNRMRTSTPMMLQRRY
jgi:hypothetical protein